MKAVQKGTTSILVSWSPPTRATGYRISYSTRGKNIVVNITDGSTNTFLLTGLENGESYAVSIVALGRDFPSETVEDQNVGLGELHKNIQPSVCMAQ